MAIPTYDALMLPVLKHAQLRNWPVRALVISIADELGLTEVERSMRLMSGKGATLLSSRVGWAKTYLKQAGLIDQPKRGIIQITKRGSTVLLQKPSQLTVSMLKAYPEFIRFYAPKVTGGSSEGATAPAILEPSLTQTPIDQIETATKVLDTALHAVLIERILEKPPVFFEGLVIDLLLALGYGGSRADAGQALGRSGDGGVDGVIREDRLGLSQIYVQAKRYASDNTVGAPVVQAFIGALVSHGASKGVLITTSAFSAAAISLAKQPLAYKIGLVDGALLGRLMIDHDIGVAIERTIHIKQIDPTYFDDADPD